MITLFTPGSRDPMNLSKDQKTILQKITNDQESGASQLARTALEELAGFCSQGEWTNSQPMIDDILGLARHLEKSRPSMAPVQNFMNSFIQHLSREPDHTVSEWKRIIPDLAQELMEQSTQAGEKSVDYLCSLLQAETLFMTHSVSSTIRRFILRKKPSIEQLICTLSGPGNEGLDLARWSAAQKIPTLLITDAQMGLFVDRVQAVVVGADAILNNGTVINKSGTFLLALAAQQAGIPFYVCCERFKMIDLSPEEFVLEEKPVAELLPEPVPNMTVKNIYFDQTPGSLITALVTDLGIQKTGSF
jgi:translation initiation factor eIF-2B subunit delta